MPIKLTAQAGEKMQYAVHTSNDNTIRFVLHYPEVLRADTMGAAAMALALSVDVLHASFMTDTGAAHWQVHDMLHPEDCFTQVNAEEGTLEAAVQAALRPVIPQGRAQLHVTLVSGQADSAVAFTVSHLVADGGDGVYLLHKLCEAYNLALLEEGAAALRVKDGSRAPEQAYADLPLKDRLSLLSSPFSPYKNQFPYPDEEEGAPRLTCETIEQRVFTRARARAKDAQATANDVLLAAYYRAYAAFAGVSPGEGLSIMSMMDLRMHHEHAKQELGIGNFSGTLVTQLENGVTGSFEDTLREVAAQTQAAKADPLTGMYGLPLLHSLCRALPVSLLERASSLAARSMALGLTNLGNFSGEQLALGGVLPDGLRFGGPLKKKPAMQVSAASLDGTCMLSVAGRYTSADAAALARFLGMIRREIERYAGAGERT